MHSDLTISLEDNYEEVFSNDFRLKMVDPYFLVRLFCKGLLVPRLYK